MKTYLQPISHYTSKFHYLHKIDTYHNFRKAPLHEIFQLTNNNTKTSNAVFCF